MRVVAWIGCLAVLWGAPVFGKEAPSFLPHRLVEQNPPFPFEHILGNQESPACTVVVYTSLSCEACAEFHGVLEKAMDRHPQVRFILRDYPTDGPSLMASLMCWRQPEHSLSLRKALYQDQKDWVDAPTPDALKGVLKVIWTKTVGEPNKNVQDKAMKACFDDKNYLKELMSFKMREKKLTQLETVPLVFVIDQASLHDARPIFKRLEHPDEKILEKAIQEVQTKAPSNA